MICRKIYIPNYDINKELMSIETNIEAKKAEVSQKYLKWVVTDREEEVLNKTTGKMENKLTKHADYIAPKGQLNSECIYEVIVSPKIPTKNFSDFCPGGLIEGRAEI